MQSLAWCIWLVAAAESVYDRKSTILGSFKDSFGSWAYFFYLGPRYKLSLNFSGALLVTCMGEVRHFPN